MPLLVPQTETRITSCLCSNRAPTKVELYQVKNLAGTAHLFWMTQVSQGTLHKNRKLSTASRSKKPVRGWRSKKHSDANQNRKDQHNQSTRVSSSNNASSPDFTFFCICLRCVVMLAYMPVKELQTTRLEMTRESWS